MQRFLFCLLFLLAICLTGRTQNVLVSGAVVGNGSYPTLTAAFAAINSGAQSSALIDVTIVNDTWEGSATAHLVYRGWASLLILTNGQPHTIAGATLPGHPMIDLDGARNVFFAGNIGSQPGLTFFNNSTSNVAQTSTIRLWNDASDNHFEYCRILGASQTDAGDAGGNLTFLGGSNGGNSNNTFTNCEFGPGDANLPSKCIYNEGEWLTANMNAQVSITDCDFHDYFHATQSSAAILLRNGAVRWTIQNNRFYQSATRTKSGGTSHNDIRVGGGYGNTEHNVRNNTFGTIPGAPGAKSHFVVQHPSAYYSPIEFSYCDFAFVNFVHQNLIQNILVETQNFPASGYTCRSFVGIQFTNCNGTVISNTIGSMTDTSNIVLRGGHLGDLTTIAMYGGNAVNQGFLTNQVGGITMRHTAGGSLGFDGISVIIPLYELMLNGNQVGAAAARIQLDAPMGAGRLRGIVGYATYADVNDNTVAHLYSNQASPAAPVAAPNFNFGIEVGNGTIGYGTLRGNQVHSIELSHPTGVSVLKGMQSTNFLLVGHNHIHSLYLASSHPASQLFGLALMQGDPSITNNMIRLGYSPTGQPMTTGITMYGIHNYIGRPQIDHNSVYLGGVGVGDTSDTYAVYSLAGHVSLRMLNNILVNARSNASGTGTHYAIVHGGLPQFPPLPTTNGNILLANGNGGKIGRLAGVDLADIFDWRLVSGQDYASISLNPNFINPTGTALTGDLHLQSPTPAEGYGVAGPTVSIDFDQQQRASLGPRDIGADAGNFLQLVALAPEIDLRGNGVVIQDGDTSPSTLDSTDFGTLAICTQVVHQRNFVLRNLGNANLTLGNLSLSGSSAFSVSPLSVTTLLPGQQTILALQFAPATTGTYAATLSLQSNDMDEAIFTFDIQAEAEPDTLAPFAVCLPITVPIAANGIAVVDATLLGAGSTDNCAITNWGATPSQFTCGDAGPQVVQLSLSDALGNASGCSATITVADQLAPQALCNNVSLVFGPGLTAQTTLAALEAGSTDNCGIDSIWASPLQFTCTQAGANAVVLSVRDSAGNVGTCIATVTVTEPVPPVAQCQPTTLQLDVNGQAQLNPALLDGGSTDNCGVTGYQTSQVQFTCADIGTGPVVLAVLDGSGNADSCSTTVTVQDLVPPTLTCANFTVTVSVGVPTTLTPSMVGTFTDACGIASLQLSQPQFTCQDIGAHPVMLTATDIHGNVSSCTVQATVVASTMTTMINAVLGPCSYNIACAGGTTDLTAYASGACGGYTYLWTTGDTTQTITGVPAGSYGVTITSADGQGYVRGVLVLEPAPLSVTLTAHPTCFGANDGFITASTQGGQACQPYHYLWSDGSTAPALYNLAPGTYSVTVTDTLGCTTTASTAIGSYPQQTVSITEVGGHLVASPGFVVYNWYQQNVLVPGGTNALLVPPGPGTYHVVVSDANGCSLTSAPVSFPLVGVEPAGADAVEVSFYPNPSTGHYQLQTSKPLPGPIVVDVYDLRGRLLRRETLPGLESGRVLDYSELAIGAYIVELRHRRGSLGHYQLIRH
jgi:hypothetical protein